MSLILITDDGDATYVPCIGCGASVRVSAEEARNRKPTCRNCTRERLGVVGIDVRFDSKPTTDELKRMYRRAQREWALPKGSEDIASATPWVDAEGMTSEEIVRQVRREWRLGGVLR